MRLVALCNNKNRKEAAEMPKKVNGHMVTEKARVRFKVWLAKNNLSMVEFAKRCGCSRQYLSSAIDGKRKITLAVREKFRRGGYELL